MQIKTPTLDLYHVLHNSNTELAPLVKAELKKIMQKKTGIVTAAEDMQKDNKNQPER